MTYLGDVFSITTYDGAEQFFPSGGLCLLAYGGFGAPPTEWITSRGYRQHGMSVLDYSVQPRTITLEIIQSGQKFCSREDYWNARASLHNILRPNRGGPLTLTLTTAKGTQRSLMIYPDPGMINPGTDMETNNWSVRESIDFVAFDPFWFDPRQRVVVRVATVDVDLVFPTEFPISFGVFGGRFVFDVAYNGTWKSYPKFVVHGPYNLATFINRSTGAQFQLVIPITIGAQRIINLDPAQRSIVDGNGDNRFSDLSPNAAYSNLVDFHLEPQQIQTIEVILSGIGTTTAITMQYYERYWGI